MYVNSSSLKGYGGLSTIWGFGQNGEEEQATVVGANPNAAEEASAPAAIPAPAVPAPVATSAPEPEMGMRRMMGGGKLGMLHLVAGLAAVAVVASFFAGRGSKKRKR